MKILCWNCWGIGNPQTVRALRRWSKIHCPDFVFVSETKLAGKDVENLKGRLGFDHAFGVSSTGCSEGLCLFWKSHCDFSLIEFYTHVIVGYVVDGARGRGHLVGEYGGRERENN